MLQCVSELFIIDNEMLRFGDGAAPGLPEGRLGEVRASAISKRLAPTMCRFLAYSGEPVFLSDLVCAPTHSLVHQSLHAEQGKTETNGDGFGLGWYGERPEPGVYRDISPAWSDENLVNLCGQVRARTFFAHVRASTGTATARTNCHPFVNGRHLFMHNGQIGGYLRIKRRLEALIPDALYDGRRGSTDSEALFLLALSNGLAEDPIGAMAETLATVRDLMKAAGITEPLRFTALLTDGDELIAYRWACDARPPSLYYRQTEAGLVVVSEPIDGAKDGWQVVPKGGTLRARRGGPVTVKGPEPVKRSIAA